MSMKISTKLTAVAVSLGLVVVGATSASAYYTTGSFSATCDPVNYGFGSDNHSHYHDDSNMLIAVKNDGSGRSAQVRLYRTTGTYLATYNIANTKTKIWGNAVAAGYYRVQAKASSTANCNGVAPGNGNFTFKYGISY